MWPLSRLACRASQLRYGAMTLAYKQLTPAATASTPAAITTHKPAAITQPCLVAPHSRLHTSPPHSRDDSQPSRMKVFYIPNPFKWFHNRMEVAALKRDWDPAFDLETFKFGVIQAVCTVTDLTSRREWGEMCGLLTQKALDKLRSTKWTFDQSHNLVLSPDDIQTVVINNISLQSIVDRKYCDIEVTIIGTRTPYSLEKHSIIMLEYYIRFHREYTEHRLPDWTITSFKLQNFNAVERENNS